MILKEKIAENSLSLVLMYISTINNQCCPPDLNINNLLFWSLQSFYYEARNVTMLNLQGLKGSIMLLISTTPTG